MLIIFFPFFSFFPFQTKYTFLFFFPFIPIKKPRWGSLKNSKTISCASEREKNILICPFHRLYCVLFLFLPPVRVKRETELKTSHWRETFILSFILSVCLHARFFLLTSSSCYLKYKWKPAIYSCTAFHI